jgi:hypothetical protein
MGLLYALRTKHALPGIGSKSHGRNRPQLRSSRWLRLTAGPGPGVRLAARPVSLRGMYRLAAMEAKRINTIRIQISDQLVEMPWHTAQELRGRLLAAGLYPLEDHFAAKGTSAPVVVGQADKEPLLVVVRAWVDEVGQEPAVALGGLLGLRDALRADLADPPPD